MPEGNPQEILDVVNEADEPISQVSRQEVHEEMLLHRAVHILLVGDGQLLLQRRSRSKRTFPGLWTSTASGHVPSGESPAAAAKRELAEEMGIQDVPLMHEGTCRVDALSVGERELVHLFTGRYRGATDPDPSEVEETRWVAPDRVWAWVEKDPGRLAQTFIPVWEALAPRVEQLAAQEA